MTAVTGSTTDRHRPDHVDDPQPSPRPEPRRRRRVGGPTIGGRVVRAGRLLGVGALGLVLVTGVLSSPSAAAPKVPIPSAGQVARARQAARTKAGQVADIQQQLAAAQDQLQTLQIGSDLAAQRYGNALEALTAAKATLTARQHAADLAVRAVATARANVGEMARTAMQNKTGLLAWAPVFNGGSPQQILDDAGMLNSVSAVLQGRYDQLQTAEQKAATAQRKAAAASQLVQQATDRAAQAKQTADAATRAQQAAVSGYAGRRTALIAELAQAQRVSVAVARQRQLGLEAQARARRIAAAKAREAALRRKEAAERAAAAHRAELARAAAARRAARARAARAHLAALAAAAHTASHHTSHQATHHTSHQTSHKKRTPTRRHHTSSPRASSGGDVSAVIAYARAQIGKPYVFGADGPSSFDCSGLTMRAWERAGREIGHYTGVQWGNVSHISIGQLRAGDLVFWGTNSSDPSTIYHTALYIGGGEIIEAPSPGRYVKYSGLYDWITPNFFGRP